MKPARVKRLSSHSQEEDEVPRRTFVSFPVARKRIVLYILALASVHLWRAAAVRLYGMRLVAHRGVSRRLFCMGVSRPGINPTRTAPTGPSAGAPPDLRAYWVRSTSRWARCRIHRA